VRAGATGYRAGMMPHGENPVHADRRSEGRWLLVCVAFAVGALLYAFLIGEWWGDVLGFLLAATLGWFAHLQWGEALAADLRRRRGRELS